MATVPSTCFNQRPSALRTTAAGWLTDCPGWPRNAHLQRDAGHKNAWYAWRRSHPEPDRPEVVIISALVIRNPVQRPTPPGRLGWAGYLERRPLLRVCCQGVWRGALGLVVGCAVLDVFEHAAEPSGCAGFRGERATSVNKDGGHEAIDALEHADTVFKRPGRYPDAARVGRIAGNEVREFGWSDVSECVSLPVVDEPGGDVPDLSFPAVAFSLEAGPLAGVLCHERKPFKYAAPPVQCRRTLLRARP